MSMKLAFKIEVDGVENLIGGDELEVQHLVQHLMQVATTTVQQAVSQIAPKSTTAGSAASSGQATAKKSATGRKKAARGRKAK